MTKNVFLGIITFVVLISAFFAMDKIYWQAQIIKKQLPPTPTQTPAGQSPVQQTFVPTSTQNPGEQVKIQGEMVCLPHKETDGPQTLECAYGIKDDSGTYYALKDSDPNYKNLSQPTGKRYETIGTFTPRSNSNYQDIGVIQVQKLTPI